MAHSSAEAEYRALAQAAAEVSWVQMLLTDLALPCSSSPTLWCDNLSTISLATNPVFHDRSKHIKVDYHYIREKVAAKSIVLKHVPSTDQLADFFTKPLSNPCFHYLLTKLMVVSPPIILRGDDNNIK